MRQVGVLCAAALVAVQENVSKLEGDHKNAKIFAGKLKTENSLPMYPTCYVKVVFTSTNNSTRQI